MHYFRPMEIFNQETSNAVMGALLINDLRNPNSAASPDTVLANPMQLFTGTSFHGGAWRTGYKFGTIGVSAGAAYLFVRFLVGGYLFLYSMMQCIGWSMASFQASMQMSSGKATLWA